MHGQANRQGEAYTRRGIYIKGYLYARRYAELTQAGRYGRVCREYGSDCGEYMTTGDTSMHAHAGSKSAHAHAGNTSAHAHANTYSNTCIPSKT